MLEAEGWTVLIIPATVPPGLLVDAFVSIHADWGADPKRRGWKLAPPWRPSVAASALAAALRKSFGEEPGLTEDGGGVTVGMRGYFGFSPNRYLHAASPNTPAVLVELGFVTNERDSHLMVSRPEYYAGIIHRGLVSHLSAWDRSDVESLIPKVFGSLIVGEAGGRVYRTPDPSSDVTGTLVPGEIVQPVDEIIEWYEVGLRGPNVIGWVMKRDLR